MDVAVIGTSRKENEKRMPIHPDHIAWIPPNIRSHLHFEKGYGLPFGMEDETICALTGNRLLSRKKLLNDHKAILITKPVIEDFEEMQEGASVWGWLHSVQQRYITQIAIDKKLTLVAWENMYYEGKRDLIHIFDKNNELAGYCGVQHALQVVGIDGNYGRERKAAVIGFGSVSRGAICALKAHGFHDITVYTKRPSGLIKDKLPGISYQQYIRDEGGFGVVAADGGKKRFIDELTVADIIVNGILQDPVDPIVLIDDEGIPKFTKACLVVDVSCSRNMGFSFAYPTTFSNPVFRVGNIQYYGVDHTPTLLWDSATWEISKAILPYLQYVIQETDNKVLSDAIDIKDGRILNRDILAYQNRSKVYPYKQL